MKSCVINYKWADEVSKREPDLIVPSINEVKDIFGNANFSESYAVKIRKWKKKKRSVNDAAYVNSPINTVNITNPLNRDEFIITCYTLVDRNGWTYSVAGHAFTQNFVNGSGGHMWIGNLEGCSKLGKVTNDKVVAILKLFKDINIEELQNLKMERWIHGGFVNVNMNRAPKRPMLSPDLQLDSPKGNISNLNTGF